jgi:hypothetical protein
MVSGLRAEDGHAVASVARNLRQEYAASGARSAKTHHTLRSHPTFASVESLWRSSGCSLHALRRLAAADAFAGM